MFFDTADVVVLSRCASRKSLELAAIPYSGDRASVRASLLVDMLVEDLIRIRLMVDLASDNLAGVGDRVGSLKDEDPLFRRSYIDDLDEGGRCDEERFLELLDVLRSVRGIVSKGCALAETISSGDSPIGDSRALHLMRARDALLVLYAARDERHLEEDTVECVQVLAVMCSQLLRVHSGRDVGSREVSELFTALGMFGAEGIREGIDALDDGSREVLEPLVDDADTYLSVLFGKAVSNSEILPPVSRNDS